MKSLEKVIKLIDVMKNQGHGIRISDLSEILDMPNSSVHRMLAVLHKHGYVNKDAETKKYKLGLQFLEVSKNILESLDLRTVANPYLIRLMNDTNETVHLSILERNMIFFIDRVECHQTIRSQPKIGMRVAPHLSSSGKVFLAYLQPNKQKRILSEIEFSAWLPNSIKDIGVLQKELEAIKAQHFAIDDEEGELGQRCVAAPVFDHTGSITAAVSISGPTTRLTNENLVNHYSAFVIATANEISIALGYRE